MIKYDIICYYYLKRKSDSLSTYRLNGEARGTRSPLGVTPRRLSLVGIHQLSATQPIR
jgi:hypothetical protein